MTARCGRDPKPARLFSFLGFGSAGAPEAAIALVLEREERWRERDSKLIAEQWKSMQRAQQVGPWVLTLLHIPCCQMYRQDEAQSIHRLKLTLW